MIIDPPKLHTSLDERILTGCAGRQSWGFSDEVFEGVRSLGSVLSPCRYHSTCIMDPVALQMHTSASPSIHQIPPFIRSHILLCCGVCLWKRLQSSQTFQLTLAHIPQKLLHPGQIGDMLEKNVNKKHSATRHSLPFSKDQMGTAWRNKHPSSGLAGQIHSDEGSCAGSPPAQCFFAGAVGPHHSWRNPSLNTLNKTNRALGKEESLAVPVSAQPRVH